MKRFLQSFGIPTSPQAVLTAIVVLLISIILFWLFGWLIGVIVLAIGIGLLNGFFTERKPRI